MTGLLTRLDGSGDPS